MVKSIASKLQKKDTNGFSALKKKGFAWTLKTFGASFRLGRIAILEIKSSPKKHGTEAGWFLIPVTAVPLPGVTGFAGYEVGGSLVLHPLSKSQQNPGVVIPRVRSRSGGGQKVEKDAFTHKSQSPCFFCFCLFQRRQDPSSCLTRPGSSPRRHSAGCTWASSAHRRHSGCSTDQELNQGDLEAGRGAVGERRKASCGAGGEEKVWRVASVHSGLLRHLCQIYGTRCPLWVWMRKCHPPSKKCQVLF